MTSRSFPSSRIVYFTLIPDFAVKSDGVRLAMSCICGFATIATLIVFAAGLADAVAASTAARAPTIRTTMMSMVRLRALPLEASCI